MRQQTNVFVLAGFIVFFACDYLKGQVPKDGRWRVERMQISPDDVANAKSKVKNYIDSWLVRDPTGMCICFDTNKITTSVFEQKLKYEEQQNLRPQQFIRFLNVLSDNQNNVNIGFEVAFRSGTNIYSAGLNRKLGSHWELNCIARIMDEQSAKQLKAKTLAYVKAWISGNADAMFNCFDELVMGKTEILNSIKATLAPEYKPVSLPNIGIPVFMTDDIVNVPYSVTVAGGALRVCNSTFKFSKEKQKWQFIGNNSSAK